jgi:hypothetical protein
MQTQQGDNIVKFPWEDVREEKIRSGSKNQKKTRLRRGYDIKLIESLGGEGSNTMEAMEKIRAGFLLYHDAPITISNIYAMDKTRGASHEVTGRNEQILMVYTNWLNAISKRKYREKSQGKTRFTQWQWAKPIICDEWSCRTAGAFFGVTPEVIMSNLKECLGVYCDLVGKDRDYKGAK